MQKITAICAFLTVGFIGCFGGGCGHGWTPSPCGSFCWKYFGDSKNYNQAKAHCQSQGGKLATMETDPKDIFMTGFLTRQPMGHVLWVWVGGNDLGYESVWCWDGFTTEIIDPHSKGWLPHEPNNCCGGEHCMCVRKDGGWNDCQCHGARPFICEKRSYK